MCGIAGFISKYCTETNLENIGNFIGHRGPDGTGYYFKDDVGLVSKRLSIIDLDNGRQPAWNEDETIIVIFNGEIFNYIQIREELLAKGHRIANNSDTAVLPHMYELYGTGMFERLSGQFGIAIYDSKCRKLVLARDRMGIIPLNYYYNNDEFFFGSEIKAILANDRVMRRLNLEAVFDVFTFWSPQYNRTVFQDIYSLLPGEYLEFQDKQIKKSKYFTLRYREANEMIDFDRTAGDIEELLCKAVQKRLIGDVKVYAYLSGGLDSSLITSIIASRYDSSVEAFSISFEDEFLDESMYQKIVCDYLGIRQNTVLFKNSEIPNLIKKIIWHTETPLLRAGPIPLFMLSEHVNKNNAKVVLSGEGSDELFGGYDIFKEVKIKNLIRRHPDSALKQQLFRKINQFVDARFISASAGGLNYFYMHGCDGGLLDSHYTRWRQFVFFERFFSEDIKAIKNKIGYPDYYKSLELELVQGIGDWTDIQKSQYLEIETFLSRYLLSSQGDRISMANSVEVRFPFLDDDLVEYCMSLNDRFKIKALNEKYIVKKIAEKYLPTELIKRKKFPYRASLDVRKILSNQYINYLLSEEGLNKYGLFDSKKISGFIKSTTLKEVPNERETMLVMGVMTLQILCDIFKIEGIR